MSPTFIQPWWKDIGKRAIYDQALNSFRENSGQLTSNNAKSGTQQAAKGDDIHQGDPFLARKVVRGGIWVACGSYFTIGFGFLANLALVRILSPSDFGLFALALSLFSLLDIRPKMNLESAAGQQQETQGDLVGSLLALEAGLGLVSLIVAVVCVPILSGLGYSREVVMVLLVLALVGLSRSLTSTAWLLLNKSLEFKAASLVSSLLFPVSYVPAFWLAFRGGGYWSLVAQNVALAFLQLAGFWWVARRRLPDIFQLGWRFDRVTARHLLRFGLTMALAATAAAVVGYVDGFLIGSVVGLAALGFYDRARRMANWPNLLLNRITNQTAFFAYARLQRDTRALGRAANMVFWLTLSTALPLALGVFATAHELISVLYGPRWLPCVPFVQFLVFYAAARPWQDNADALFTAVGRPGLKSLSGVVEAMVLVGFGIPLTYAYGAMGMVAALGLSMVAGLGLRLVLVDRTVVLPLAGVVWGPMAGTAAALAIIAVMPAFLEASSWPLVILLLLKGFLVVAGFYLVQFLAQPRATRQRVGYTVELIKGRT